MLTEIVNNNLNVSTKLHEIDYGIDNICKIAFLDSSGIYKTQGVISIYETDSSQELLMFSDLYNIWHEHGLIFPFDLIQTAMENKGYILNVYNSTIHTERVKKIYPYNNCAELYELEIRLDRKRKNAK